MNSSVHLAGGGALQNLGTNLIQMFTGWAPGALEAACGIIVVVTVVRRFSIKAGIGAVLGFVLVLALFQDRDNIAQMFTNQIQSAATTSSTTPNGMGIVRVVSVPGAGR
jgi:phosphotransferase system  glucose/maltose/N-acetylglucosamine-specific IIC component